MKDFTKAIVGGLSLVGLAVAGYRAYEIKKIRKAIEEEQIIDVTADKIEEVKDASTQK